MLQPYSVRTSTTTTNNQSTEYLIRHHVVSKCNVKCDITTPTGCIMRVSGQPTVIGVFSILEKKCYQYTPREPKIKTNLVCFWLYHSLGFDSTLLFSGIENTPIQSGLKLVSENQNSLRCLNDYSKSYICYIFRVFSLFED